ncbi:tyrosine-type recombinase/integrase [Vagococcus xieshaowenii]|uniref:tyrosine-type recombinase/integrase n=1 Tax=Vagococcus xieshaowenii TaxID=2562451 RepID=UPI001432423C|nr:tyrosine-type recombinase/integrase [Vagococcus xieshaowenii]
MLSTELLEEFILDCQIRNLSKRTIETYEININIFWRWVNQSCDFQEVSEIKKIHFKRFVLSMLDKGYKETYINTILKALKAFYYYLFSEEYIKENCITNIKLLKEPTMVIETFNDDEIKILLSYFNKKDYLSIRNRLIVYMLLDTGLRCSELRSIKVNHVYDNYLKVCGKGNKWRVIPTSKQLQKEILKYRKARDSYIKKIRSNDIGDTLFLTKKGNNISTNATIELIFKEITVNTNIRDTIRCSPHTCRHWFAKTSIKNGQDIYTLSKILGHSNIKITQRYLESMSSDEIIQKGLLTTPLSVL